MKEVLFATGNNAKLQRFEKGLAQKGIKLLSLKDIDLELDVNENGKNAIENARIKAEAYYNETKMPTIAMDDTLYLENVPDEFQPGMYVRRVNGKRLTDDEMIEYYSGLADKYGTDGKLIARWVYGMATINANGENVYTWSKENFYMVNTPTDKRKEGYPLNSISINIKLNKYFTDITEEDKELIKEDELHVIDFIANNI